jgi:hypothetical protein
MGMKRTGKDDHDWAYAGKNPTTIAFVVNCYLSNAISTLELQTWAADVAGSGAAHPDYLLALTTFDAPRFHV